VQRGGVLWALDEGKNLSGAKLEEVDRLSLTEIAAKLTSDVGRIRGGGDTPLQRSQGLLKRLPGAVLGPIMRMSAFAMFDLDLDLSRVGVPYDPFGSVVVSNIGVFGIARGFAPLIPSGRTAAILTVGCIEKRAVAIGDRVEVRPMLTISGTFDHRVVDGHHLGRIQYTLRSVLEDPRAHLGAAELSVTEDSSRRASAVASL
jgi:pyruvate dehydrogenase E2 component (dihydrolipoamide acetyltransferase)